MQIQILILKDKTTPGIDPILPPPPPPPPLHLKSRLYYVNIFFERHFIKITSIQSITLQLPINMFLIFIYSDERVKYSIATNTKESHSKK